MDKLIVNMLLFALFAQSAIVVALLLRGRRIKKENEADAEEQSTYLRIREEERKIAENISEGIKNSEFKMYLQFIVDGKTKKIVSAEALSRWDNPKQGIIMPVKYIGDMETTGLISKHDFYMFELACRQLEKWNGTEFKDISVSCNFTRITLSE
ncbi:MAG: EAL domain-containing protein, partial [Oscillospiraceae bacterium]|nr:EAL domain-containing protein [Oscillospiraceae bacterium]